MRVGLDIGSTTIKCVVLNDAGQIVYSTYERHFSHILEKGRALLEKVAAEYLPDGRAYLAISGSAGMGLADSCKVPFVQEVFATRVAANRLAPGTDCIIELGGEDAKILFLTNGTEVRMNGSCAGGSGRVHRQHGFMIMETECPDCGGRGRKVKDACPECKGAGTVPYAKELKIKVPAGIDDGTRIRLAGEGMPGVGGGTNGDLYIFVTVREHKLYSRQGADLFVQIPVSMACAALGGSVEIPGIDGHKIEVKVAAGTQSGQRLKIKGEGMPKIRSVDKGDLWVEFKVETPVNLSPRQKELLEEFRSISGDDGCQPAEKSFFEKIKDLFAA